MSNAVGNSFGDYQILSELGRGGMAIVYKAYEPSLRRYVALKVLPVQFTFDTTFVQRFDQEARTAAGLDHPNIITIFKVGEAKGTHYIAMRLIEGGSLQQLIRRVGALSSTRIVYMVQQLASALDYAHRQGLIHRDIKASNVMLGDQDHVTLTDFGIARAAEGSKLTQAGTVVGTPEYMSPEQARGEEIDRRSDIYSLGVVVYEMFAGRVPFVGTTPHSVLHKQVYETPPPLRAMARGIPRDVEKVINQALAKDPKKRYQSAGELAHALAKACGIKMMLPLPLRPVTTPIPQRPRQAEGETKHLEGVGGIAGSTPGGAGAETVGVGQIDQPPGVRTPVPMPVPGHKFPWAYVGLAVVALAALASLAVYWNGRTGKPTPTPTSTARPTTVVAVLASATLTPTGKPTTAIPPPTAKPSATSSPTAKSSATPSPTVKPSATHTPTVKPSAARTAAVLRPVLLSPANEATMDGDRIILDWDWARALGPDEHFDVRVWREGAEHYGIDWTEQSRFERQIDGGKWYWSIAVVRQTGYNPDGSKAWIPVSAESEVRWFEFSNGDGDATVPAPTPRKPTPPVQPPKPRPSPDGAMLSPD